MDNPPEISTRNTAIGVGFLLGEIGLFLVVASCVKILSADFPVFALLFCRYAFSLPLLLAYGIKKRGRAVLQISDRKNLAGRIGFGFAGLIFMYAAFGLAEISLVSALLQTMPIFVTLLAIPMLGEAGIGLRRITAVCAGFIGVVILLGPAQLLAALDAGEATARAGGIAFAILGAFFTALMLIYLRRIGRSDAPISTTLWYNITGMVFAACGGMFDGSAAMLTGGGIDGGAWFLLVAIGVISSFQQFMLTLSYFFAPASVLAPVHYANIPLAAGIGIVFFGETISGGFIAGAAIIVAANYYIMLRERALGRKR